MSGANPWYGHPYTRRFDLALSSALQLVNPINFICEIGEIRGLLKYLLVFYKVSVTAFNFNISLSKETTTREEEDMAARTQSTISVFEVSNFSRA
jgi:hypothetical protein